MLYILFLQYTILAFLVVILSIYLSKYVDALDKKTNLSGAFIGGVMLAAVTSLPELFTSITAIVFLKQEQLVQGNILGSNLFNLTIIAVCVLFASKEYKKALVSKTHITTTFNTASMFFLCLMGMTFPVTFYIGSIKMNWVSILIVIFYGINVQEMQNDAACKNDYKDDVELTVKQILVRFCLSAAALIAVSIMMTNAADRLAERLELGKTVAGAIFLGIATSLPELTTSINLVRLKNFNASIGNIIGSNSFNFTILAFMDLIFKGNMYNETNESFLFIMFGMCATFLTMFLLNFKRNLVCSISASILIICMYISCMCMSM